MERKRSVREYVKIKIRRFWQIAKRRPQFLFKYLMRSLIFRAIVMSLYFLFFTLLPISSFTELWNGRALGFIRDIPVKIQGLQPDMALAFLKDLPTRFQAVQFDTMLRSVRALPTDISRVLANLSTVLSTRGKWLWEGIKSLWPPAQAKAKIAKFTSEHLRQVRWITRAILSFILSLALLKLILIFIVPLLGLSALTILGLNIGVVVLFALQAAVTALSRFLSRVLQGKVLAWYKQINELWAVQPVGQWASDLRNRFLRNLQKLVSEYLRWLNKAVYAKQDEYEQMMATLRGDLTMKPSEKIKPDFAGDAAILADHKERG